MVVVYVVQKESAHECVGGNRPQDFHRRKVMHASVRHLEQNIVRGRRAENYCVRDMFEQQMCAGVSRKIIVCETK